MSAAVGGTAHDQGAPRRALKVAALVKQVPVGESLTLGPDGRLERARAGVELNAYCRRAVSKGVELAQQSGGTCTVFTLGPPSAEDVLREAVAWGADGGVHVCDPAFAGSDTLATARALVAALQREGPFDLVLVGRNSLDGDTAQVGPEVAELCGLPFASGVRELALEGERLDLRLEHDDGWEEVSVHLPAVLSVAERLCEPCKVPPEGRARVPSSKLQLVGSTELGGGPWGQAASPTVVGAVRVLAHERMGLMLGGGVRQQVEAAVRILDERGALTAGVQPETGAEELVELSARSRVAPAEVAAGAGGTATVAVVIEPGRRQVARELLGAAAGLAAEVGGKVVALRAEVAAPSDGVDGTNAAGGDDLAGTGADEVVVFTGAPVADDVAAAVLQWCREEQPWAVLAPSTAFGREVAARTAAALGAGLIGDAVGVAVVDGVLVAAKPAFAGALVADITCTSAVQLVTIRPGLLSVPPLRPGAPPTRTTRPMAARGRVVVRGGQRDDDVEVLARAEAVIGVGTGVEPGEYSLLSPLAALLDAELAATRKVTDKGWAPRARQVGITGRSIAPRLYVALGLSGKFNHMVGVRAAGTVLAVNSDPEALVFGHADVGIVGDWHEVVPELEAALRARSTRTGEP